MPAALGRKESNMHILEQKIRNARAEGRTALIPFIPAGFPSPERFRAAVENMDAHGADIIEIGIPFSDPVADGPVVEEASRRALASGVTLRGILKDLRTFPRLRAGLVLVGYMNPILQYGPENFARDAADAGVTGCAIPDLPLEESGEPRGMLGARGIALIPLVGQNTTEERMREYAAVAEGFVHVVSVMGTTGARESMPPQMPDTLRRARAAFSLPLALDFGPGSPEQPQAMPEDLRPDAAVCGPALLRHIDAGGPAGEFLDAWRCLYF